MMEAGHGGDSIYAKPEGARRAYVTFVLALQIWECVPDAHCAVCYFK